MVVVVVVMLLLLLTQGECRSLFQRRQINLGSVCQTAEKCLVITNPTRILSNKR